MRGARRLAAIAGLAFGGAAAASPPSHPTTRAEGLVTRTDSRWTSDGSRIVTEATIATPAGDVVVSQLGGRAGGFGMIVTPGPELLEPGMRVAVAAYADLDGDGRTHNVLDTVRVLALPEGFVRTGPTKAGASLYWESGCVLVSIDAEGTKALPGDTEFPIVEQCIETWNAGVASCSYMNLSVTGRETREVGNDHVNVIKFRDATWCRPKVKDDPARCYAESAAGLTTAVYVDDPSSDRDGAIVDADVEINGKFFAISDNGITLGAATCKAELANTLTHELGHLLGLEHPCLASGDPRRTDNLGRDVPLCSATSDPTIVESTMYNFQDCGETKKASLEADDIAGVCSAYPTSRDPGSCKAVPLTGPGCCSANDGPGSALVLFGLTAIVGLRRRRQ